MKAVKLVVNSFFGCAKPERGILSVCLLVCFFSSTVSANCEDWIARVVSIQGNVDVQVDGNKTWVSAKLQQTFCEGDVVRVNNTSRAALELHNETIIRLNQNSTLVLSGPKKEVSWVDLIKGSLHSITRVPRSLKIKTPFVNAAVEGTEFQVQVNDDHTLVGVIEGVVAVSNDHGSLRLKHDQSAVTYKGKAPVLRLDIKPTDSVQWSLYYPRTSVAELKQIEDVLAAGQVDAAEKMLAGNNSADALALRSIIAIAKNKKDQALTLSQQAIQSDSASVAAHIAHSYVLQARFNLSKALQAAKKAVQISNQNAIAWVRLSELHLSLGELSEGLAAAKRAVEIEPNLARTQTLLGFAHLLQYETEKAKQAFTRSIELDSSDPLARLGNGLATIREGKLKQGRREIEIAASLDTNNSVIRSYLGKAYYEEKRNKLAADQFALAKQMDPKDPTPWLYDAIRKQSDNDPVGALSDLRRSKALNNNRAVFRSTQFLDRDAAARSVSQAGIYGILGAEQLALVNGWDAVNLDFTNHSAHRFLADTYARMPRHKIARVSELLQSQLFQPLNADPVRPQLLETNLGAAGNSGVQDSTYGEYSSLFSKDGTRYRLGAVVGSDNTFAEDVNVSGVHKSFAYSVGQYHYETDGFRDNNDLKQDIYNIFLQSSLNASTDIQAEFRSVESEYGDLDLFFDVNSFSPTERNNRETRLSRIGINHRLDNNSRVLVSLINKKNKYLSSTTTTTQTIIPLPTAPFSGVSVSTDVSGNIDDSDADTVELQFVRQQKDLSYVAGIGYFDEDRDNTSTQDLTVTFDPALQAFFMLPPVLTNNLSVTNNVNASYKNIYVYANKSIGDDLLLTLGAAYDDMKSSVFDVSEFNPKLGLTWNGLKDTAIRMAYFEGIGRPINAEHTIEPTQVAGFNQIFDDFAGSKTRRYGIGIDHKWNKEFSAGMELSWRKLESPTFSGSGNVIDMRDEQLHRGYIQWHYDKNMVLSAEFYQEEQKGVFISPNKLITKFAPLSARVFWQGGNYSSLIATYVNQEVIDIPLTGEDTFWTVDLSVGLKLPRRLGEFRIEVKNLLDKNFSYYVNDRLSKARGPISPRFVPERQIFARFVYAF